MATLQGVPGQLYRVRNNHDYQADATTGLITNVAPNDIIDLIACGATLTPPGPTGATGPAGP